MKKTYSILVALGLLLLPLAVSAQTMTNSQKRLINAKVWDVVETYEEYVSMRDQNETKYVFTPIFTEDAQVVCDLIGTLNYLEMMPIEEYIQKASDNTGGRGISADIYDVRMASMNYIDGKWIIPVTFKKQLSYFDTNGIYFDVNRYYDDIFNMKMSIVYDEESDECRIRSIHGDIASRVEFPKGRYIIVEQNNLGGSSMSNRDHRLLEEIKANGESLSYDEDGIGIYAMDTKFEVRDFDVTVDPIRDETRSTEAYDIVNFSTSKRSSRLKVRGAFAPMAYDVKTGKGVSYESNAFEVSLDYGATFVLGRNSKMGFYIGAGASFSNIYLNKQGKISYTYSSSIKEDGIYKPQDYKYDIKKAEEAVSYTDVFIPIYFEAEHRLDRKNRFVITWNIGAKPYLNLKAESKTPYTVTFAVNDGGYVVNHVFDKFLEPNSYAKKNIYDLSVFGNLGLDFGAVPNLFYVSLQVGYERGVLGSSYESKTMPYYSDSGKYPIIPQTVGNDTVDHIAVNSLISGVTATRSALWISLGVKLKF